MHEMELTATAMNSRIQQQEIIANNLANVNTVGFKRDKIFQEILSGSATLSGAEMKEVIIFEQGNLRETQNPLDFGLSGEGFFSIQTSSGLYYTRNGSFGLNPAGLMSLEDGLVMGHNGPVEIRGKVTVNEEGDIYVNGKFVDRLRIVTFPHPFPLKKAGSSLFALTDSSIQETNNVSASVKQGMLEESNVNPIEQMVDMLTLYRYFEADQKALHAKDDLLGKAANDVGRV